MAVSTKYTYSIAIDTLNGLVAASRLMQEIQNSVIIIAIDTLNGGISTNADTLDIWFKDVLTNGDQITLTNIVNGHTGAPLLRNKVTDINVKTSALDLPIIHKGFKDLTGYNLYYPGHRYVALKNTINKFDVSYTQDYALQGMGFRIDGNAVDGDNITVEIVDVDGVVFPAGTILVTFAKSLYVWSSREFQVKCDDAKTLYSWAYLRLTYDSVGLTNDVVIYTEHYLRTLPV